MKSRWSLDKNAIRHYTWVVSLPRLPLGEIEETGARFCAGLQRVAPALVPHGRRLLARIAAPNWTLEWGLPRWLGDAFGLPPDASAGLVLANAYGLAFVRLVDGLADGESAGFEPAEAVLLAGATHSLWVGQVRQVVEGATVRPVGRDGVARFWRDFDEHRSNGVRAMLDDRLPPVPFRAYTEADFRRLAARGAPLKVCCAAACLLAGREHDLPALADAIDQLLVGAVLLDHALDWPQDLAEGRPNAFVAYASGLPQTAENRDDNRRRVLEAILLRRGARPYFARIGERLRAAHNTADALPCAGLAAFLGWLDRQTAAYAARLRGEANGRLRAAVGAFMRL
jgi:hypothetical protein